MTTLDRARQTRKYAEDLIGPNNRGYLDTQRKVAKDIYQTNFDTIQNNFKNLKERLELQRNKSNLAFNKGLSDVADSSYNRVNAQTANLVGRGLTTSGLGDRVTQGDTATKGEAVQKLLSTLGGDINAQMEALKQGGEKVAASERELNAGLSDTLGDIGASDLANQMNYNKGVAGLAGSKDARDDANELARLQRAASAAASSSKKSKEDEELEQYYKNKIIANIITGYDIDTGEAIEYNDQQKQNALKVLFDIDGDKVISAYNYNNDLDENIKKQKDLINKYEKELKKQNAQVDLKTSAKDIYDGKTKYGLTMKKDTKDGLFNQLANSDNDIISWIYKNILGGVSQEEIDNDLANALRDQTRKENELKMARKGLSNMTMKDLAEILYGSR